MAAKTWKSCQNVARRSKPLVPKTRVCYTRVYVPPDGLSRGPAQDDLLSFPNYTLLTKPFHYTPLTIPPLCRFPNPRRGPGGTAHDREEPDYIYIYIYIYTYIYIYIYIYMYPAPAPPRGTPGPEGQGEYIIVYTYIYIYIYTHIYIYICHTHMYIYIYIYVYRERDTDIDRERERCMAY